MPPHAAARRLAVTASTLVILSACSAGQNGVVSPSVSTGPSLPASEAPSLSFSFPEGDEPVVSRQLAGSDEDYINPGAIIDHDGRLHMYANVFTAWPGRVEVRHLTSEDGIAWTLAQPEPVLTSDDVPLANPGIDVSTGFVDGDGTWVLIFETVALTEPWVLGRATAPGPDGPWTVEPEPILEAGPAGSFDAGGVAWPSVVPTDAGFAMFYTGYQTQQGTGAIGMATSADGATWTRAAGPVLEPQADWESGSVDRPRVAATPDELVMVYAGRRLTDRGLAWSDDGGATWSRDGTGPALTRDDFPISASAWDAALIYRDGALHYFLEIGLASGTTPSTEIYRAVSVP
jgi:predicted GH43/DUF377 family glycosyl hydrolase